MEKFSYIPEELIQEHEKRCNGKKIDYEDNNVNQENDELVKYELDEYVSFIKRLDFSNITCENYFFSELSLSSRNSSWGEFDTYAFFKPNQIEEPLLLYNKEDVIGINEISFHFTREVNHLSKEYKKFHHCSLGTEYNYGAKLSNYELYLEKLFQIENEIENSRLDFERKKNKIHNMDIQRAEIHNNAAKEIQTYFKNQKINIDLPNSRVLFEMLFKMYLKEGFCSYYNRDNTIFILGDKFGRHKEEFIEIAKNKLGINLEISSVTAGFHCNDTYTLYSIRGGRGGITNEEYKKIRILINKITGRDPINDGLDWF